MKFTCSLLDFLVNGEVLTTTAPVNGTDGTVGITLVTCGSGDLLYFWLTFSSSSVNSYTSVKVVCWGTFGITIFCRVRLGVTIVWVPRDPRPLPPLRLPLTDESKNELNILLIIK